MEKRFISGLASKWYGVDNASKSANELKYADSIVFIKNDTDQTKGDAIWAQGAYFEMNNVSDVQGIIEGYLKEGKNIDIEVDGEGLKISAVSIDSISGLATADETKLVEAKAVAGALTNPFKLTLAVNDNVGQFTQHFKNLKGEDVTFASAVIEGGDGITLTQTEEGLEISANLTKLKEGLDYNSGDVITVDATDRTINHNEVAATTKSTGTAINPTSDAKSFDIKSYGFDKYGHIATETTTTVTLPDTAFTDNNTEYELSVVKQEGAEGKSEYDVNLVNKDTKVIADTVTFVPGANVAMALNGTKGIEVIATDTKYDLGATANATDGVDVNLTGTDKETDSVTFVGGSNVEVSLKDGKVEISSSFENTTYDGENAIVVTPPAEGETEGKVSLKIDESDLFLSQSDAGLKANIEVAYDSATNYIYLKGVGENDKTVGFNASAFVKDSFVESVTYVDQDAEGNTGKFLKFVFVVVDQDGQKEFEKTTTTTYVDVTELVNTIYDVEGDSATYSVVEESVKEDGTVLFTVKNTLGTISRDNASNTITVSKAGIATVGDIKTVLETIDSDLDAVKAEGADANEIAVVTGVTQVDGKITAVDSGLAATKAYVDGKFGEVKHTTVSAPAAEGVENYATVTSEDNADGSTNYKVVVDGIDDAIETAVNGAEGEITLTADKGNYTFAAIENKDGYVKASQLAEVLNDAWAWGTIA